MTSESISHWEGMPRVVLARDRDTSPDKLGTHT